MPLIGGLSLIYPRMAASAQGAPGMRKRDERIADPNQMQPCLHVLLRPVYNWRDLVFNYRPLLSGYPAQRNRRAHRPRLLCLYGISRYGSGIRHSRVDCLLWQQAVKDAQADPEFGRTNKAIGWPCIQTKKFLIQTLSRSRAQPSQAPLHLIPQGVPRGFYERRFCALFLRFIFAHSSRLPCRCPDYTASTAFCLFLGQTPTS